MKNLLRVLRISIGLIFSILFFSRCSSFQNEEAQNKPLHNTDTVIINQMKFAPAELTVHVGDTIVWINKGLVAHNVTEEKNKAFYSDTIETGTSWKWVVSQNAEYLCTLHPTMKGKILITE